MCCLYLCRYMNAQEKVCKEAPQTADSVILGRVLGAGWLSKGFIGEYTHILLV